MDYLMCDAAISVLKEAYKNEIVFESEEQANRELIDPMNK